MLGNGVKVRLICRSDRSWRKETHDVRTKKGPNKSGLFLRRGVHPSYAAEAFLITSLRVSAVESSIFDLSVCCDEGKCGS